MESLRADDYRKISCALCRFVRVVTHITPALHSVHHLYLIVPTGPKDNQTTNDAGRHRSNRETNPKTPEFYILFEGEIVGRFFQMPKPRSKKFISGLLRFLFLSHSWNTDGDLSRLRM